MPVSALQPLNLFRLDDRVVIVTGASSGLGQRFARVVHGVGATVVIAARRRERLDALAADLPGALPVTADLSDESDREKLVAETVDAFGRVDVLVNNAGVGRTVAIDDEPLDVFRNVMEVNVTSLWHLSKLVAPSMIDAGRGSIVNIASMLGHVGSTPIKQANYCASKGAVVNMTREMALQWARKGVRVNALCPGWFPSEMTEGMETEEGGLGFIRANSPMPRMGEEHELDGALLYLAGDASTFVTGQSLIVDGGWTAR